MRSLFRKHECSGYCSAQPCTVDDPSHLRALINDEYFQDFFQIENQLMLGILYIVYFFKAEILMGTPSRDDCGGALMRCRIMVSARELTLVPQNLTESTYSPLVPRPAGLLCS